MDKKKGPKYNQMRTEKDQNNDQKWSKMVKNDQKMTKK